MSDGPWVVQTGIELEREVTATAYASRTRTATAFADYEICGEFEHNAKNCESACCAVAVGLLKSDGTPLAGMTIATPLLNSTRDGDVTPCTVCNTYPCQCDPTPCPPLEKIDIEGNFTVSWGLAGDDAVSHDDWRVLDTVDLYVVNAMGRAADTLEFSDSISATLRVRGTFKLMADTYPVPGETENEDEIWGGYWQDRNPAGPPPQGLVYYYVPTSDIVAEVESGSWSDSQTIEIPTDPEDLEAFEAAYRNGLGGMDVTFYADPYDETGVDVPLDTAITGGTVAVSGASLPTGSVTCQCEKCSVNSSGGGATLTTTGEHGGASSIAYWDCNHGYSGSHTHSDLTDGSTATVIQIDDPAGAGTETGKSFSRSVTVDGEWEISCGANSDDHTGDAVLDEDEGYQHTAHIHYGFLESSADGITNLSTIGEPIYNESETDFYRDARCVMYPTDDAFDWEDAVTLETSDASLALNATGWTVTGGTATQTTESHEGDTWLKVVVGSSDVTISKTYSESPIIGRRFAQLQCDLPDSNPIAVTIGGREYGWSDGGRIDLLNPAAGISGDSDDTQTLWPDGSGGWAWPLYQAGTIEFDLKADKTYWFYSLDLVRATEAEGGAITAVIFAQGGGFVKDRSEGTGDAYTMFRESDEHLHTRVGVVFVDGAPAAELHSISHEYDSVQGRWSSMEIPLESCLYPDDGLVDLTVGTESGWRDGARGACYLVPGVYSGYEQVSIDAALYVDRILAPVMLKNVSVGCGKCFRGRAAVVALDAAGALGQRRVVVKSYDEIGGTLQTTQTFLTNAMGLGLSPALRQDWYHEVETGLGEEEVTAAIGVRNRNASILACKAGYGGPLRYCAATGALVSTEDGELACECC